MVRPVTKPSRGASTEAADEAFGLMQRVEEAVRGLSAEMHEVVRINRDVQAAEERLLGALENRFAASCRSCCEELESLRKAIAGRLVDAIAQKTESLSERVSSLRLAVKSLRDALHAIKTKRHSVEERLAKKTDELSELERQIERMSIIIARLARALETEGMVGKKLRLKTPPKESWSVRKAGRGRLYEV
ncbi:MAG: hypothetical protein QW559_01495 [Candidatus Woesearchaeota archaeon]